MHLRYVKRQDITAVPSANGVGGSQTAGDPSGTTKLVVGSNTGTGTSSTDGPDFAFGEFVSLPLGSDILFSQCSLL